MVTRKATPGLLTDDLKLPGFSLSVRKWLHETYLALVLDAGNEMMCTKCQVQSGPPTKLVYGYHSDTESSSKCAQRHTVHVC